MMEDAILLRQEICKEVHDLDERKGELLIRLRKLDAQVELEAKKKDAAEGRTNACGWSWRSDETCAYCGSMNVARAIELLKTQGTEYSGADWKYGWPHKFYIGRAKFYNNHLADATPEQLVEFSALSDRLFCITWDIHEGKVRYKAAPGIQKYGTVGEDKVEGKK